MRFHPVAPLALLLVVVSAAVSAAPAWVAYETAIAFSYGLVLSGMVAVSFFVAGAVAAAWLTDAGHARTTLVAGALAVAVGVGILAIPAELGWIEILVPAWVRAAGQGAILVVALSMAARTSSARWRPWVIGMLLAAAVIGSELAGFLLLLDAGIAVVVAIAVLGSGVLAALALDRRASAPTAPRTGWAPLGGAVLLAGGLFVLLLAIDPTNTSLLFTLTPLQQDIRAGEVTRAVMAGAAAVALAAGGWLSFRRLGATLHPWPIAVAVAAGAFAAGVVVTRVAFFILANDSTRAGIFGVADAAALLGILGGALWVMRTGAVRMPATAGAAMAAAGVGVALWLLAGETPPPGALGPAVVSLALVGGGIGVVGSVLRAALADADATAIGAATAIGVIAAEAGSEIGSIVGRNEWAGAGGLTPTLVLAAIVVLVCLAGAIGGPSARPRAAAT